VASRVRRAGRGWLFLTLPSASPTAVTLSASEGSPREAHPEQPDLLSIALGAGYRYAAPTSASHRDVSLALNMTVFE